MLSSFEYAEAANPFHYSMLEHDNKYSSQKKTLDQKRKGYELNKKHLKPNQSHQWLEEMKTGNSG